MLHDVGTVVPTNESCERDEEGDSWSGPRCTLLFESLEQSLQDPATTAMRDVRALLDVLTEHFAEPQDGQRTTVPNEPEGTTCFRLDLASHLPSFLSSTASRMLGCL